MTWQSALLPYIEEQAQTPFVTNTDPNASLGVFPPGIPAVQAVPVYLCPSRRGSGNGPVGDYGSGFHPKWYIDPNSPGSVVGTGGDPTVLNAVASLPGYPNYNANWYSILGAVNLTFSPNFSLNYSGTTLQQLTNGDGTTKTILLGHKGIDPSFYPGGDQRNAPPFSSGIAPNDVGWSFLTPIQLTFSAAAPSPPVEHKRRPYLYGIDNDNPGNGYSCSQDYMGGPHPGGSPVLFADGSGRVIAYSIDSLTLMKLWAWNDNQLIPTSALGVD
jgi:prepilin-type processing-associated H-X9-DG protein